MNHESNTEEHYMGGIVPTSICTFTNYRKLYLFPKYNPRAGPKQAIKG